MQPLWIEGRASTSGGEEAISGYAVAVGWDRPQGTTFYLVSDASVARPVWVPEDAVTANSIRP
jgi:hypothetical protein